MACYEISKNLELIYSSQKIVLAVVMHASPSNCLGERRGSESSRYMYFLTFLISCYAFSFFSRPFFPNSPSEVTAVLIAFSLQQFLKATVRDQDRRAAEKR